jgi:hypothetical protein
MNEALCFVQFLHPGYEGDVPADGIVPWNTKKLHKRKFLRSAGTYVDGENLAEDELVFWGEWEPPSQATPLLNASRLEPHWLHTPFRELRDGWAQNTDPFVFGDRFRYSICQQHRGAGRPTQLAKLLRGSVVLFGSGLRDEFRLDTVFVVAGIATRHSRQAPPQIDRHYEEVVMKPYYHGHPDDRVHALYDGAAPQERMGEMFSFFPCRTFAEAPHGFARPTISMPQITATHKQSYRLTRCSNVDAITDLWREVVRQVEAQGCRLGVRAALPPLRSSTRPVDVLATGSC